MLTQICRKFANKILGTLQGNCNQKRDKSLRCHCRFLSKKFFITNFLGYILFKLGWEKNYQCFNKSWISLDFQKEKDEIISLSQTVKLTTDRTLKTS